MTVCERIKYLRKDVLGMTQQEFADKIAVKRNTVATYETGRSSPSDSALSLICREFGVNEAWLRDGIGEMFKPESGTPLGNLAEEYHLSDFDQSVVLEYLKLSQAERDIFKKYMENVLDRINSEGTVDEDEDDLEAFIASIPDTPEELERMYPTFDVPPDLADLDKMG